MNKPYKYEEDEHEITTERVKEYRDFFEHLAAYVFVNIGLFFLDLVTGDGLNWFIFPLIGWGIGLAIHGASVFFKPFIDRLAKRFDAKVSVHVPGPRLKWPKKDSENSDLSSKLKYGLNLDFSKIGRDISNAMKELEQDLDGMGLGMGYPKKDPKIPDSKSEQIPQKPSSGPAMPQGVAILMFTDIEGFSTYVERNGDEAGHSLLKLHNHIIRASLKANDGIEIKNLGDGFMLCFVSAKKALQCAADIQSQLQVTEFQLKVRMGIHAGEPIREGKDLTGQTVNLAARVMDQANGGQIFVTDVVRNLAGNLKGFQYADQGERRLPGLSETQKLYEFVPIEALASPTDSEIDQRLNNLENQL